MALSADNIIQENTGENPVATTSHVVTLPGGVTAGNTLLVFMGTAPSIPTFTTPAGWATDANHFEAPTVFRLSNTPAGGTSWTFTTAATTVSGWYACEVSGLDLIDPLDLTDSASGSRANGATLTRTPPTSTAGLSTLCFATIGSNGATGNYTWGSWTNGFVGRPIAADGPTAPGMSVAVAASTSTTTYGTTATFTTTSGGSQSSRLSFTAYREAGIPIVAPLAALAGFEWGTHGGGGNLGVANSFWGSGVSTTGTWNTQYLIQAGSARNGGFGLRTIRSAAAVNLPIGDLNSVPSSATAGFNVRVISGSGVVPIASFQAVAGLAGQLVYDVTNTKFGVRIGAAGTVSYQPGTTALNTWAWVDLRCTVNSATWSIDWRIETAASTYTSQTGATLGGQTASTVFSFAFGSPATATATVDYDDLVLSRYGAPFPLGPHTVRLLKVDAAGTPTISGTTTNFGVFTANTTVGAWNAANARNAVDEVPPTISASADGFTQIAAAATDYGQFPMETYTLAVDEVIAGVRMYAPLWSATSAAADLAVRGFDGTVETALAVATQVTATAGTAVSATHPQWRVAMWPSTNGWTQTELDAAALRVGFSADATPDIGVHAIYLEVATTKTRRRTLFGDGALADEDPNRLGVVSVTVAAPAMGTGDTTLEYGSIGSPTTVPITEGTTVTTAIGGVFNEDIPRITVYWPPEPTPPLE